MYSQRDMELSEDEANVNETNELEDFDQNTTPFQFNASNNEQLLEHSEFLNLDTSFQEGLRDSYK